MSSLGHRLRRIAQKLRLRLALAWKFGTGFEDAPHRSRCRVSFSQCGEDQIVWFICTLLKIDRPRYLDIGAHDPVFLSNTALFSLLGATGMNIEPDPTLFAGFLRARPRDLNLNIGIAEFAGQMNFFKMTDPTLNTFSQAEAERMEREGSNRIVERLTLPVEPISAVLRRCHFTPDFLSIDVEGRDLDILRTYDFEAHRPAVICAETLDFTTAAAGRKNTALINFVTAQGYRVYADTYINTIFVDQRRLPLTHD